MARMAREQLLCLYILARDFQKMTNGALSHPKIHHKLVQTSSCSDCIKYIHFNFILLFYKHDQIQHQK